MRRERLIEDWWREETADGQWLIKVGRYKGQVKEKGFMDLPDYMAGVQRAGNSSGVKGVQIANGRWSAVVKRGLVPIRLGVYDTVEEAIETMIKSNEYSTTDELLRWMEDCWKENALAGKIT